MQTGAFPRRFGSYVLLKPLARGGMGELDLAVTGERGAEKLCVIKKVLPHLLAGENVQRFRDEVMVVVRLSHGNLVGVLDAGREDGESYLALDFVEGKDLLATWNRCATKRIAFPVEIATYIVKELVRGLGYAHGFRDLNLVHRDVSPANVLLSYTGEVKLTDFGLATSKLKEQHTAPGIIFGKLAYLAPEQARGEVLDGRTDLYSAGILLWEMLTGQQLFPVRAPSAEAPRGQDSTIEALERVKSPKVPPPSKVTSRVPPELDEIVMRALAPRPEDRYQNGEAMRSDLASFLAQAAPETDAATLATFLTLLFEDQIVAEREERDALLVRAFDAVSLVPQHERRATPPPPPPPPARPPEPFESNEMATPLPLSLPLLDELAARREPAPPGEAVDRATSSAEPSERNLERPSPSAGVDSPWWSQSPDKDQRVGTTIGGRYFLRRLCGEGAMGRVYEGHHIEIGRRVAVKILHVGYSHTPDVVERFRREARAASKIGHPNIVDVTDSGLTAEGALFFVMDYLDGANLEQLIAREGPLAPERALLIAAQVCRALVAAHAVGIVHRDLKPANVMLGTQRDGEDFVKVLDFGISKQSDLDGGSRNEAGLTRPDAAVGTPIYMAPEQIAGLPADARTDVYAVGELLYEMLTGSPPYQGSDVMVVFNKKANQEPAPVRTLRADLPAAIEVLIERAMSRRPENRHATMALLKDAIIACLSTPDTAVAMVVAPATATAARHSAVRVGSRALWIIILGTVVGLGCGAAFLLARIDLDPPLPSSPAQMAQDSLTPPTEPPRSTSGQLATTPSAVPSLSAGAAESRAESTTAQSLTGAQAEPNALAPAATVFAMPAADAITSPPAASGRALDTAGRGAARAASAHPSRMRTTSARMPGLAGASRDTTTSGAPATVTSASPSALPRPSSAERLAAGRAAFAKGDFPGAVRASRAALAMTESAEAHQLLGDAFFKLERFADAIREYDSALLLTPNQAQARRARELAGRHLNLAGRGPSGQSTP